MADDQLIQCPHCDTTFRVHPDQLAVADGHVRCGSCYQVFHAGAPDTPAASSEDQTDTAIDDDQSTDATDDQATDDQATIAELPSAEQIASLEISQDSIEELVTPERSSWQWQPAVWGLLIRYHRQRRLDRPILLV